MFNIYQINIFHLLKLVFNFQPAFDYHWQIRLVGCCWSCISGLWNLTFLVLIEANNKILSNRKLKPIISLRNKFLSLACIVKVGLSFTHLLSFSETIALIKSRLVSVKDYLDPFLDWKYFQQSQQPLAWLFGHWIVTIKSAIDMSPTQTLSHA